MTQAGEAAVRTHPEGFTLEVPDRFDDAKIAAYKARIRSDRGLALRSVGPDVRWRSRTQRMTKAD